MTIIKLIYVKLNNIMGTQTLQIAIASLFCIVGFCVAQVATTGVPRVQAYPMVQGPTANHHEVFDNRVYGIDATLSSVLDGQKTPSILVKMDEYANLGLIEGRVSNTQGQSLPSIAIQVFDIDNPSFQQEVYTDSDGVFRIDGLFPGQYQVGAFDLDERYAPEWFNDLPAYGFAPSDRNGAEAMTIASNESYTDVDIILDIGGVISGTVSLPNNSSLDPTMTVILYRLDGTTWVRAANASALSTPDEYLFSGLPSGTYTIMMLASDGSEEYYGNVASVEQTAGIRLLLNSTVGNVDFVAGLDDSLVIPAPRASFAIESVDSSADGLSVSLKNLSVGAIDSYAWNFGDGNSSAEESVTHSYASTDAQTVTLTVTGPGGEDSFTLQVQEPQQVFLPTIFD